MSWLPRTEVTRFWRSLRVGRWEASVTRYLPRELMIQHDVYNGLDMRVIVDRWPLWQRWADNRGNRVASWVVRTWVRKVRPSDTL